MNWRIEDLKAYTMRRLRNEQAARTEMQTASIAVPKAVPKAAQPKAQRSGYNTAVVLAWFAECGLPVPVPEFRFHPERLWRFDFCFVASRLAVEVNGSIFSQGRHTRGAALLLEYEKLSEAAALGYRVIFTTPDRLMTKATVDLIREALTWGGIVHLKRSVRL